LSKAGRFDAALQAIEDGLATSRETGEEFALAEALRIKAQLLSEAGDAADKDVEALLKTSLRIAGRQNARFFELRAACDLARRWRSQDKCSQALSLLKRARSRFIEGSDSEDLREATALIQRLELSQT
jgi:predicted ATPase